MLEWIIGIIARSGLWGVLLLAFLENLCPPIPSEIFMPCAGYLIKQGKMSLLATVSLGALGAAFGSLPLYCISRALGETRVRGLLSRYGKWVGLGTEEYDKTQGWFARYGNRAVFWCRIIPGLRGIISIPAGVSRMPVVTFLLLTYLGCFLWMLFLVMAGYWLGDAFLRVEHVLGPASKVIVAALVVLLFCRAYKKITAQKKDDAAPSHGV